MVLTNLTTLLNRDFKTGNQYPYFITTSHSRSSSRGDASSVETIHIDINSDALSDDFMLEEQLDITADQFITYFVELGLRGYFKSSKAHWATYIHVHTGDDVESDIEYYITIVKTDLSFIITLIDVAL